VEPVSQTATSNNTETEASSGSSGSDTTSPSSALEHIVTSLVAQEEEAEEVPVPQSGSNDEKESQESEPHHANQVQQQQQEEEEEEAVVVEQERPLERNNNAPIIVAQQKMLQSFQISLPLQRSLNLVICQAMLSQNVVATVHDFVLLENERREVVQPACIRDYHRAQVPEVPQAEIITEDQLSLQLLQNNQLEYYQQQIVPRCFYLRGRGMHYFLCKRPIELLYTKKQTILTADVSWWQRLMWGTQQGFYYAIVINFSLSQRTINSL
jgi:hypothetical protein